MRVLIAGATGAIGRPLVRCLRERGHAVFALARSPSSSRAVAECGAEPLTADALDAAAVKTAIGRIRPEAVINELTSLPRHYTPAEMQAAAPRDAKIRIDGNANLLAAFGDAGVRRYVLQSSGFWYAPGAGLADESAPFAFEASPSVADGARRYAELEATALATPGIEFVALRYGFFYGPGTWFSSEGDMGEQVRRQEVPIIGNGEGVWNWVHVDDAAAATAAALGCVPGAYNIVGDDPTPQRSWLPAFACAVGAPPPQRSWLPAFACAVGAPPPPRMTEQEALGVAGPDTVYYATRLRGAANTKAKRGLNFHPRLLEWLSAGRSGR